MPRPVDKSKGHRQNSFFAKALLAYRMRWKRRRLLWRSWRSRHQLTLVSECVVPSQGILVFSTMRNEILRIEHWLSHYRKLGVAHFVIVDNASDDGTTELLAQQPDVSLWTTPHSYKASRFGVDWLTYLQMKQGHGRWCLTVDADEVLIFPEWEKIGLSGLTTHLDNCGAASFAALMLDMYPKGPISASHYVRGSDPVESLPYFDPYGYTWAKNDQRRIFSIRGGPRKRYFFESSPEDAPHLHKIPLVKWRRSFAYLSSTHDALPRHLNDAFDARKALPTGALLHSKFLSQVIEKSAEEKVRSEHFTNPNRFDTYYDRIIADPDLWFDGSARYKDSAQLEQLGLITRGNWAPK